MRCSSYAWSPLSAFKRLKGRFKARTNSLLREEHGNSMIEMAYTLPVLMLVVTGVYTFGIAINNNMVLTNATQVAAQQLAISRNQTTDPCQTVSSTFYGAAPILTKASLTFTYVLNGTSFSGTSCTSGAADLTAGSSATVTVTYPCTLKVYGTNLAPNCMLKSQTTELVQ